MPSTDFFFLQCCSVHDCVDGPTFFLLLPTPTLITLLIFTYHMLIYMYYVLTWHQYSTCVS